MKMLYIFYNDGSENKAAVTTYSEEVDWLILSHDNSVRTSPPDALEIKYTRNGVEYHRVHAPGTWFGWTDDAEVGKQILENVNAKYQGAIK